MAVDPLHRPTGAPAPRTAGIAVLFPGTGTPPWHHDDLLLALADATGIEAAAFGPAGIGRRRGETTPVGPAALAAEAREALGDRAGPRVWIGHSWGGHAARTAALGDPRASALVLVDPNLGHAGPPDPARFDPPARLADRAAAVALYHEHGIPEEHIVWSSWETAEDGSLVAVHDADVVRAHIAATPWGRIVIDEIRLASERMPVAVVRTGARTINAAAAWEDLRHRAPAARILEAPGVHHVLPRDEQAGTAALLAGWLREVGTV